ncbi:MAG TPA: heavy metal-binding domain-containing protein [Ktedonobacteraceae bacterium]
MSSQVPPQQGSDLPMNARERLNIMRGDATHKALFTSDLTVNEFLLVREAGFDPVGLVVGSSIYHIGYQMAAWNQNQEMNVLTQAMYHARELAMTRMEEEANALSADGIVGVRLEITRHEWGESLAEFVAIGTAIRARNGQSYRNVRGLPFTSDLSGQDFWTLLRTGYRPVGMVMGNCVYHVARQGVGQWFKQVGQNVEMTNYTQALYDARELAMERMQAEAISLGAQGVVGAQIHERSHGWGSHIIEFFAVGTAVISISDTHEVPPPSLALLLND